MQHSESPHRILCIPLSDHPKTLGNPWGIPGVPIWGIPWRIPGESLADPFRSLGSAPGVDPEDVLWIIWGGPIAPGGSYGTSSGGGPRISLKGYQYLRNKKNKITDNGLLPEYAAGYGCGIPRIPPRISPSPGRCPKNLPAPHATQRRTTRPPPCDTHTRPPENRPTTFHMLYLPVPYGGIYNIQWMLVGSGGSGTGVA